MAKLKELLLVEAECERAQVESIAADTIPFKFEERLEIYSKLTLFVPKSLQQHVRNHVVLSVAIRHADLSNDYVGTGQVKRVRVLRNEPDLIVSL